MSLSKSKWAIYSGRFGEKIVYYPDDLNYSCVVFGVGLASGKGYNLTFDEEGNLAEIEEIEA